MSRIGDMPITVPSGVEARIDGGTVTIKGPKGELTQELPAGVSVALDDTTLNVSRVDDSREARSMHGLARSLVANMIEGVTQGYTKTLEINGVGYRAEVKGQNLTMLVGLSSPVQYTAPDGVSLTVENNTTIVVSGIDKQKVGDTAARLRGFRPAEPYKGKGIQYRGERIRRKVGKTVA